MSARGSVLFQTKKLKRCQKRLGQLRGKIKSSRNVLCNIMPMIMDLSKIAKTLVLMQLRGAKRKSWTEQEKQFATSFFYKSPAAYFFLRGKGLILPSPSTVRRWISINVFKTGFDKNAKRHLKLKCSVMNENEKKCVVAFDEMSIKEYIEYNKKLDLIEGFEDLGPLGRSEKKATHALVFSIRGLYTNWKTPVAYFFSCHLVTQDKLKHLILHVINELQVMGFTPKVMV